MPTRPLSGASITPLVFAALVLGGCSSTPLDPTENWSPNRIYSEAQDEIRAGAYAKAIPLFDKLEGRAAGTPLAQQAQLDKAYAQYKNGDLALAIATLDRFMKQHPASPALDYALYLKGVVDFNDDLGFLSGITRQDLSERDQKAAKDSFAAFRELTSRFPKSKYAEDGAARMRHIVNMLAKSEVNVARYYFARGAYVAAINRAQTAITDYDGVPALEEALYILVKSYDALGMPQLSDDARRVLLKNYPQSEFLSTGGRSDKSPWWKLW